MAIVRRWQKLSFRLERIRAGINWADMGQNQPIDARGTCLPQNSRGPTVTGKHREFFSLSVKLHS